MPLIECDDQAARIGMSFLPHLGEFCVCVSDDLLHPVGLWINRCPQPFRRLRPRYSLSERALLDFTVAANPFNLPLIRGEVYRPANAIIGKSGGIPILEISLALSVVVSHEGYGVIITAEWGAGQA